MTVGTLTIIILMITYFIWSCISIKKLWNKNGGEIWLGFSSVLVLLLLCYFITFIAINWNMKIF